MATALPLRDPPVEVMSQPPAFDCVAVMEIPHSECEALVALYNDTDGANWYVNTGWLQTTTPCSWYGVTCTAGHVSYLVLDINGLNGPLPLELGNLAELQSLSLSLNSLTGPIPPEWCSLTVLQVLSLSNNQLSGPLPFEIGHLGTLRYLNLSHNQFGGPIPAEIGQLTHLELLELQHNQLRGPIPSAIGNLTVLRYLDLSYNQLSGSIPPELGHLTNMRAGSLFEHTFGVLKPPPTGGYLYLTSNQFSGTIPVELGKLTQAAGVDLGCNQLRGSLPIEVGRVIGEGTVEYNMLSGYDPTQYPYWYWNETQTTPPLDVRATVSGITVTLTWTPIAYTSDGGFYEISYATAPGSPFTVHGQTADKAASRYTVTGLAPSVYYFRVRTFTPAHQAYWCNQRNDLWSDNSTTVSASIPPIRLWLSLVYSR